MRALLPIGVIAFIGAAATAACTASVSVAGIPPLGAGVVVFSPVNGWTETSCSGDDYIAVEVSECPDIGCDTAYALCDNGVYAECACDIPSGWTEVVYSGPGSFGGGAGGEGGTTLEGGGNGEGGTSEEGGGNGEAGGGGDEGGGGGGEAGGGGGDEGGSGGGGGDAGGGGGGGEA